MQILDMQKTFAVHHKPTLCAKQKTNAPIQGKFYQQRI